MKVVVKRWGNSASVRIPAFVMADAALSLDQAVDVREDAGRIVIEPIDWRALRASRKGKVADQEPRQVRGKLRALIG
jgi:antitoxin component of MazEF toxin-antitoxin module